MELLIVGAGEMGRWLARTMNDTISITFADRDENAARDAADERGTGTVALDSGDQFDAVCFAVPLSVIEDSIAEHASRATQAIFDVSGVMDVPLRAMAEHAPELERVSIHPLFSARNSPGNIAVVVDEPGPTMDRVLDALSERGNELVETSAAEHDELMETVQAKAHAAILSFALTSDDVPDGLRTPVYDGLQALVEQVTDGSPHVYREIQTTFEGAEEVATAARQIADADTTMFDQLYNEAGNSQ